jgi:hypothetical protein
MLTSASWLSKLSDAEQADPEKYLGVGNVLNVVQTKAHVCHPRR